MQRNSRSVITDQVSINRNLQATVRKHLSNPFHKPFKAVCEQAFDNLTHRVANHCGPLVFDSGCGTGESTIELAHRYPNALVVGIDKSAERIRKAREKSPQANNLCHLRADLVDIWRLARAAGWQLAHHYILYPNPWPKKRQFKRRWHAHPVFPDLLELGGLIHLRSNWQLYLEEFATAVETAMGMKELVRAIMIEEPISAFEKKYFESGQQLFELKIDLIRQKPILSS